MTQTVLKILDEIKTLNPDERAELLEVINDNFKYELDPEIEKAWAVEAEKRYENFKKNRGISYSIDEVFNSISEDRNK
jgi:putative addiction module component (TIGR02574 family)